MILRKRGMKPHPGSGSGMIAFDGSNEDILMEIKDANKSFTMVGQYLLRFWRTAVRQKKHPVMVVYFSDIDLTAEVHLKKGKH